LLPIGVFGAALFYGDAVLTPAISVLSAVEGTGDRHERLQALCRADRHRHSDRPVPHPEARHRRGGHAVRSRLRAVVRSPRPPAACLEHRAPGNARRPQPAHAAALSHRHGYASFVVLGSVLLAITGAEALYADMGHFGKRAIRLAWFGWSRTGPGAELLRPGRAAALSNPDALENPFYLSFPLGALPDGGARHRGHRDRLAGHHLRRLFDDAAGDAAGLPAAHGDAMHTSSRSHRPDLRAGSELDAAGSSCAPP
jgi:KUP system potassium uptake protein